MKKFFTAIGALLVGLVGLTGVLFLAMLGLPLTVFFGWLAGKILCLFAGAFIATALTTLLGVFGITTVVTVQMIPYITAALAFITYYFKVKISNTNNNTNNNN